MEKSSDYPESSSPLSSLLLTPNTITGLQGSHLRVFCSCVLKSEKHWVRDKVLKLSSTLPAYILMIGKGICSYYYSASKK